MDDTREIARILDNLSGLPDSLGFLGAMFANAPFGLALLRSDGHCLLVNRAFRDLFGSEPPADYDIFKDEIAEAQGMTGFVKRAFAGEIVELPTFWYDPRDLTHVQVTEGRRVAISVIFFPLRHASGELQFVAGVYRDDTEKQLAREEANEQRRRAEQSRTELRDIVDLLPALVFAQDVQGRFLFANAECAARMGKLPSDVEGKTVTEVTGVLEPARQRLRRESMIATGEPRIVRGEPSALDDRVYDLFNRIYRRADLGEPAVLTVALDVSHRVATEEALRISEARYRAQFDSAPEAILTFDVDTFRFVEVNERAEQMFEMSREQLLETPPLELSPPQQPDGRPSMEVGGPLIERAMAGERPVFEWVHRTSSGRPLPCEVRLVRLPASTPSERLCRASIVDITARKVAEELRVRSAELEQENRRAQEANRLKTEFLANMSHELRTPLNAIIGFAELLHDGRVDQASPQHHEFSGDILASARHLLQLINDILDLTKVEAGKLEFRPEPTRLSRAVGEVVALLRGQAADRRVRLAFEQDAAVDDVFLDPARFKQVLFNFLSNAIKFTPEGGSVIARTRPEPNDETAFRLEVEDTGIGIGPSDLPRLFVEFQQLDGGLTKRQSGTGLGLALTRRLVEAQGGHVGVQSVLGKGSVFYAVLPRRAHREPHPTNRPPRPGASHLLVVEDEVRDARFLVEHLEAAGYAVTVASTVSSALAVCRERRFDAIILDLLLPDGTGLDFMAWLREQAAHAGTPVIVVSVVANARAAMGAWVQDIIPKPIEPADLLAALVRAGVPPEPKRSVLVIDDEPQNLRLMEAALLELGYDPITRSSVADGLEAAKTLHPAAVILDLLLPDSDGFDFLDALRRLPDNRRTPVLVWTVKELSPADRLRLRSAVVAYLPKGDAADRSFLAELEVTLAACARQGP
jgi:PAS domain S-box-containing protein